MLISKYYYDDKLQEELEIAIKNIIEKGWTGNFNYSSGVFGNLDVLIDYSFYEGNSILRNKIIEFINSIVAEKTENYYGWTCAPIGKGYKSNMEMTGYFTGISGISNTLLNLIDHEKTAKLFD